MQARREVLQTTRAILVNDKGQTGVNPLNMESRKRCNGDVGHYTYANDSYAPDDVDVVGMTPHDTDKTGGSVPVYGREAMETEVIDEDDTNCCQERVAVVQESLSTFYTKHKSIIRTVLIVIFVGLYFVYFGYAMYHRFGDEGSLRLLVVTSLVVLYFLAGTIWSYIKRPITERCTCSKTLMTTRPIKVLKWLLHIGMFIFIVVYLIVDVGLSSPENMVALGGIAFYIVVFYIFSAYPAKVKWRPVFWGFALQFIFALLILRTEWGFQTFKWLGDRVTEFLDHSNDGAIFVFGEKYLDHIFAMKVLPVIVFFSTFISILYYLGVMQFIIKYIARFIALFLGTTPAESLNAAGNIFIGMTEAPLLIRPFLENMTRSELHAIMTGGFATIAGSVLGAYISFGVPANHLLSASFMSAPAALAISKLAYPETEVTHGSVEDFNKMEKGKERNVIEAASSGASMSISLVANVAVNVMAFIALLAFVNATLDWFGDRVGVENLSFQFICSYVLWPLAYLMGVGFVDCRQVAQLIGIKTFINEFVAYTALAKFIDNRLHFNNYTSYFGAENVTYVGDDIILNETNQTLTGGYISIRSEVIATYALCGFSNIGSIGITLGGLGALAPSRRKDLSGLVVRSMIAGNVACFLTACIAGLLYSFDG